jgi:hypothetical protein
MLFIANREEWFNFSALITKTTFCMAGQTIPVSKADDMIKAYYDFMTNLGVNMEEQTQSISFTANILMDWLKETLEKADELRVFMGLYPPEHAHAGRTTVILWPYLKGQRLTNVEPFNDGTGRP